MPNQAFTRLATSIAPATKYPVLSWDLREAFRLVDAHEFYVELSADLESWARLNPSSPLTDTYTYTDETIRRHVVVSSVWYRVVLVNGSDTYTSSAIQLPAPFTTTNWIQALHVVSAEYFRLVTQATGIPGVFYKRRKWGTPCTVCLHEMTGLPLGVTDCTTCYGTGIVGGYFEGVAWYGDFVQGGQLIKETEQDEQTDVLIRTVRGVAFPLPEKNDMWVDSANDVRYIVDKVQYDAELGGVPLICSALMKAAPFDDAVYLVS